MNALQLRVSIIIPTYNEATHLPKLLDHIINILPVSPIAEIIISDGQSTDETLAKASGFPVKIVKNYCSSRAIQLNKGAQYATGDILYFLHADTFPPPDFIQYIIYHVKKGYHSGCFRLKFDSRHWLLRAFAWFTRFNISIFRFGDQSLFITKALFNTIGGYREDYILLEDQEIIERINKKTKFVVMPDAVVTSARKYRKNGVFRLKIIFLYLYFLYKIGTPQAIIAQRYRQLCR